MTEDGKRLGGNIILLGSARIIGAILSFFGVTLLARVLGASGFGLLNFGQMIFDLSSIAAVVGLPILAIREVAGDKGRIRSLYANITVMQLLFAILLALVILVYAFLLEKDVATRWVLFWFAISLIPVSLDINWLFTGLERLDLVSATIVIRMSLYVALILWLIRNPNHASRAAMLSFISLVITVAAMQIYAQYRYKIINFAANLRACTGMLKDAWFMGFHMLITYLFFRFDIIVIRFFHGDSQAGYYTAAFKLVFLFYMFHQVLNQAFYPLISRYYQETRGRQFDSIVQMGTKLGVIIALPLFICTYFIAPWLINFVFGAEYQPSIAIFQILIVTTLLNFSGLIFVSLLNAMDKQRLNARNVGISVALNIVIGIMLIRYYGCIGAAIATTIAHLLLFVLNFNSLRHLEPILKAIISAKPIIAALCMTAIIAILTILPLSISIIISLIAFFTIVIGLGYIEAGVVLGLLRGRHDT